MSGFKQFKSVPIERTCGKCGLVHREIPSSHAISTDGYWFQCGRPGCDNTLFVRARNLPFQDVVTHALTFIESVRCAA